MLLQCGFLHLGVNEGVHSLKLHQRCNIPLEGSDDGLANRGDGPHLCHHESLVWPVVLGSYMYPSGPLGTPKALLDCAGK